MLTWFKSLFDDMSAGTLLVMASMSVVLALMFALGEIASRQAEIELPSAGFASGSLLDASTVSLPMTAGSSSSDVAAPHGTVSVMVPVGGIR